MLTGPLVALVDFRRDGHHLTYLQFFHRTLTAAGYRVVVFSPATDDVVRLPPSGQKGGSTVVKVKDEVVVEFDIVLLP